MNWQVFEKDITLKMSVSFFLDPLKGKYMYNVRGWNGKVFVVIVYFTVPHFSCSKGSSFTCLKLKLETTLSKLRMLTITPVAEAKLSVLIVIVSSETRWH